ncbi:RNA polymerase II transcription elongation factor SPT5 [Galdieria sulphuraria]|uniref:Transcription elongation factor SPT5 n=1 Tax=Galdieria sulphuraria TaxID=130081 RepID=M2XF11_GALSU|nr:RNA polymerase II transcription elongation factor SPT5 [Galdieria sulphuraria]EME28587.1 RNA polymerase II transcription elongation factor SPT5 [Galdieria sulphuraria]|eukprot:XP_005705107.1 RNA polymerase II transcription elongation factor SPT5 [Galdieria sulphuraria]
MDKRKLEKEFLEEEEQSQTEWKKRRKQDNLEQSSETSQDDEQDWGRQGQEDDYEDDEEYSEEEEENNKEYSSKKKKRSSRFIELEAEVDEEDDDEEAEEGDEIERELIDDEEAEEVEDTMASVQQRKALLDRMRSENPEELRRFVRERYGEVDDDDEEEEEEEEEEEVQGLQREYIKDKGIEQQGLLPTVQDPKLFLVKCRIGREKEAVICLLQKYYEYNQKKTPLDFFSAVAPEHLRGYVYVEAYTADSVKEAIDGLRILFPSTLKLIPIEEMVDVLSIVPETSQVERGGWVRISRGTYAGDLAQVYDFREGETNVTVRLIPRLDLQEMRNEDETDKKRLSVNRRPPQKLFKREEVEQIVGSEVFPRRDRYTGEVFDVFRNENYRDGLLYKRVSIRNIVTGDEVAPTFEELEMFHKAQRLASDAKHVEDNQQELEDTMEKTLELSLDTLSSDVEKNMNFCVGDSVIVVSGDLKNLSGRIEAMESDNMVAVRPDDPELKGELIQFSKEELKKYFREGTHVKAINGRHTGETGMVVGISGDIITVFSDITNEEVRLHISQLTETTEESSSKSVIGSFELLDLVTLHSDPRARGVIVRIQRDHATLLDTNGSNRTVSVKDIRSKLDAKRAQALDMNQKPLQVGDMVKVVQGVHKNREGSIRHVASPFVFVNVKDEPQNCGLIVVRAQNCQGPHSVHGNFNMTGQNSMKGATLSSMFSLGGNRFKTDATLSHPVYSGNIGKGHKEDDKLVRQDVLIKSGPWKGYIGKVVSATTASVRVELDSVCKTVTVDRSRVVPKDTAHLEKQKQSLQGAYTPSYEMGSQTPAYSGGSSMATPLHHVGYTPVYAPFTPTLDSGRRDAPRTPIHNAWRPTTPGAADYSSGNKWSDLGLSMYSPFASQETGLASQKTLAENNAISESVDDKKVDHSLSVAKAWIDVLVEHKTKTTIRGYVGGHSPDGMYLQIELEDGNSGSYALSDMQMVAPEKSDVIKVVDGEYTGMKGHLLNAEGDEGIVQFEDGEIKILPVSSLGKIRG